MKGFIKLYFIQIITFLILVSCASQKPSLDFKKPEAEIKEIDINFDESKSEVLYFSDIISSKESFNYITGSGTSIIDSSITVEKDIIGIKTTDNSTMLASDRKGNISLYQKIGDNWELTEKIGLSADGTSYFNAFTADKKNIALFSGSSDSIYLFPYSKYPKLILKLYSGEKSFTHEITDMDINSGYIYMLDTENRVFVIDTIEKRFEAQMYLKSIPGLKSLAVSDNGDTISIAATSPGSEHLYIFPLSEQYLMKEKKGFIKKAGITSFNYGTHVLVSANGKIIYALESSLVNLSDFTKGEVTVTGRLNPDYPVDGGPELLTVSSVSK